LKFRVNNNNNNNKRKKLELVIMVWPGKIKYYLRDEVVIHNSMYDIWVIVQCRVFDLTRLIRDRMDTMNDVGIYYLKKNTE